MRRLVLLLAALALATPAAARPPVWVVKDKDSELVLFGSVHVLPPGLDWKPPALAQALARADDLWFEVPPDAASRAASTRAAGKLGVLAPGQSLFKLLPTEDAARLTRVAKTYGVSATLLDHLQPWMAEMVLAGAAFQKAGAATEDGVETAIAAAAPTTAARRSFETPADQVAMLASMPAAEQLASLRATLKSMEETPDEYDRLVRAWSAGDLAAIDRLALAPVRTATPRTYERLVKARNAAWTKVLHTRLKGRGRTVVVVGMGHLIGPDGLPARLRALGYSVKGP